MGSYAGAITAFHVIGLVLAIWALVVTAVGIRSENFPRSTGQARLVGAISVLLALGAISSAIIVGALEDEEEGGEAKAKPAAEVESEEETPTAEAEEPVEEGHAPPADQAEPEPEDEG